MKHLVLAAALAALLTPAAASVAGKWTLSVNAGPHGDFTMGLTLKQEGTSVSGTFSSPHGDMAVAGEFADGALKIATTQGSEDEKIYFQATLNEDGTLSGYMSSPMGDMKWTASRASDGK